MDALMQSSDSNPECQRTRNLRQFLEQNNLLVERVLAIIDFMRSVDINLPILLWAISWNVPELRADQ
jgi:hypothetical protein